MQQTGASQVFGTEARVSWFRALLNTPSLSDASVAVSLAPLSQAAFFFLLFLRTQLPFKSSSSSCSSDVLHQHLPWSCQA